MWSVYDSKAGGGADQLQKAPWLFADTNLEFVIITVLSDLILAVPSLEILLNPVQQNKGGYLLPPKVRLAAHSSNTVPYALIRVFV